MKKQVLFVALVALLAFAFVGCSSDDSGAGWAVASQPAEVSAKVISGDTVLVTWRAGSNGEAELYDIYVRERTKRTIFSTYSNPPIPKIMTHSNGDSGNAINPIDYDRWYVKFSLSDVDHLVPGEREYQFGVSAHRGGNFDDANAVSSAIRWSSAIPVTIPDP